MKKINKYGVEYNENGELTRNGMMELMQLLLEEAGPDYDAPYAHCLLTEDGFTAAFEDGTKFRIDIKKVN